MYADVRLDIGDIILTTENGVGVTNTIYLDPSVLEAFDRFREALKAPEEPLPGGTR